MDTFRTVIGGIFRFIARVYRVFRWLVLNFIFIVLLVFLFTSLRTTQLEVPSGAALVIDPRGVIVEETTPISPLTSLLTENTAREVQLRDILDAIEFAGGDPDIQAIVLRLNDLQNSGFSKLRDIARALEAFRSSGKPVYAIADNYSQGQYYLASHADEILLNPMGGVDLRGFGAYQIYFGEALQNMDVNVHVFRVGEFKSAVEPFQSTGMSEEARSAASAWLDDFWNIYLEDVSARRNLTGQRITAMIENIDAELAEYGGDRARLAVENGLVDRLASRTQTRDFLTDTFGPDESGESFRQIAFRDYLRVRRGVGPDLPDSKNDIGIIVASGVIYDGWEPRGNIGGDSLSELIRQARRDDSIRALVLRIDSPGGSAFASEVIRNELLRFRASGKPLVVSMGSTAASGGYWIATPADEIWAGDATLTGSIGIFGILPTFENTMANLGLYTDGVGTTSQAGTLALGRDLPESTRNALQQQVESGYRQFLNIVADARDMTVAEVDAVAQGRVWSAGDALERGLVDELGGLDAATASAANMAGLDDWDTRYVEHPVSPGERFLRSLTESVNLRPWLPDSAVPFGGTPLQSLYRRVNEELRRTLKFNDPNHLYLHCFGCSAR